MKAMVFANLNHLPLVVTGYNQIKIGPYLRGEKSKRKYRRFFAFQKSIIGEQVEKLKLKFFASYKKVFEPSLSAVVVNEPTVFVFSAIPHWQHFFDDLRQHRPLVKELFHQSLSANVKSELASKQSPEIGVHIRMGDFRSLKAGEDFKNVGAVRTPETYFRIDRSREKY
ncbi:MAG TPA: hypothetical protein DCQ29_12685 [Chitinophagaceae bacterium]|nr:hypothetical protein [Chitinophagaceae bacterium]